MTKKEVKIGATYVAKVSGALANVRIVRENPSGGWDAINTATDRKIRIRGVQRLRKEVVPYDRLSRIRTYREGGLSYDDAKAKVENEFSTELARDGRQVTWNALRWSLRWNPPRPR
jgi:hypothetical protein